jgi:hypothetical protein
MLQKDDEWFEKYGSVVQLRGPLMVSGDCSSILFCHFSATSAEAKDTRNRFFYFKTLKRSTISIKVPLASSLNIERGFYFSLLSWVMDSRRFTVGM